MQKVLEMSVKVLDTYTHTLSEPFPVLGCCSTVLVSWFFTRYIHIHIYIERERHVSNSNKVLPCKSYLSGLSPQFVVLEHLLLSWRRCPKMLSKRQLQVTRRRKLRSRRMIRMKKVIQTRERRLVSKKRMKMMKTWRPSRNRPASWPKQRPRRNRRPHPC